MTAARLFKIENRLGELFRRPGGKSVRDALGAAEHRVREKLGQLAETLPAATARLKELADLAAADPGVGLGGVYEASNQIFALAGAVGFAALADAAYSLCDLVEGARESGRVNWNAVRIHADAIRLLGARAADEPADAAIAAGLKALGAHLQRPPGGRAPDE
jgi:hypothetical protein